MSDQKPTADLTRVESIEQTLSANAEDSQRVMNCRMPADLAIQENDRLLKETVDRLVNHGEFPDASKQAEMAKLKSQNARHEQVLAECDAELRTLSDTREQLLGQLSTASQAALQDEADAAYAVYRDRGLALLESAKYLGALTQLQIGYPNRMLMDLALPDPRSHLRAGGNISLFSIGDDTQARVDRMVTLKSYTKYNSNHSDSQTPQASQSAPSGGVYAAASEGPRMILPYSDPKPDSREALADLYTPATPV